MRRTLVALIVLVAGFASPHTAAAQPASDDGRALAQRLCAKCHAVERTGASPLAIAPPFRDLPKRYPVAFLAEALAEGIVTGHPEMPRFTLTPQEIDALLAHIDGLAK